jgi:hypothetical protein
MAAGRLPFEERKQLLKWYWKSENAIKCTIHEDVAYDLNFCQTKRPTEAYAVVRKGKEV